MMLLDPDDRPASPFQDVRNDAGTPDIDAEPNLSDHDFACSVAHGLGLRPRRIASKWLYDDAGAALFEEIVASPGYYVPEAEVEILRAHGPDIAAVLGAGGSLVELGSGSSRKVRHLLDAMPELARYVPVEISRAQLLDAAEGLRGDYPGLEVVPIAADFTKTVTLPPAVKASRVMGFFPGSTLCNLLPGNSVGFLRRMHALLGPDSWFLVGVDLKKDEPTLLRAYNDPGGAIWRFNLNIIDRINRELGTALDKADFRHEATYNAAAGRVEAAIYPERDVVVSVAGATFDLAAHEPIVLEYSHKYTVAEFQTLAAAAGWRGVEAWTDAKGLFSVHLLTNGGTS